MKLIALRDFFNNVNIEPIEGQPHPNHIHKGAIFNIGGEKVAFDDLKKADKETVALLNAAKAVGDATDEKTVKRIQGEVAAEKKADAARVKVALAPAK